MRNRTLAAALVASIALMSITVNAQAQASGQISAEKARVIEHWTAARRAAATPRDLVIDHRGLGYLRLQDGSLRPYGHQIEAVKGPTLSPTPMARPGGGNNDTTPPAIANLDPGSGDTIGTSHTFSATVTDESGVKSVTFVITYPDGTNQQSFTANDAGGGTWSTNLQGFTDGNWSWHVEAKDTAKKGGNLATSGEVMFMVSAGGGGGGGGSGVITNSPWVNGGVVQEAAGRIYFEMPGNARWKGPWSGYVCSGTVVSDNASGKSTILTAAHCVYDDANGAYARNVLFIPNQAGTTGSGTDRNCDNDPIGCWAASYGVVDTSWTQNVFPNNVEWDSAYYVVDDSGSHSGNGADVALDAAVTAMSIQWTLPALNDVTHGLGYSYSDDPQFMYCAEEMTTEGAVNWWLPSCDLSGGSSGGPWVQPMNESTGNGPVISVNSWGYTTSPGMAGPKLSEPSHVCVFDAATAANNAPTDLSDGNAGIDASCP